MFAGNPLNTYNPLNVGPQVAPTPVQQPNASLLDRIGAFFTGDIGTAFNNIGLNNTLGGVAANTVLGLNKAAAGVATDIFHGVTRAAGAIPGTIAGDINSFFGTNLPTQANKPDPITHPIASKLYGFMFGDEPIDDLGTQVVNLENTIKNSPFAQQYGFDKFAAPLAFGGVVGGEVLNLYPGSTAEKNLSKELLNLTDETLVRTLLTKTGVPEEVATKFAPIFAKSATPQEVQEGIQLLRSSVGMKAVQDEAKVAETFKPIEADEGVKALKEEAKKYNTPDEFHDALFPKNGEQSPLATQFAGAIGKLPTQYADVAKEALKKNPVASTAEVSRAILTDFYHDAKTPPIKSVGEVLSDHDKLSLAHSVLKRTGSAEEAAVSSREYNRIFDDNDHQIVDHYNELLSQRTVAEIAEKAHPDDPKVAKFLASVNKEIDSLKETVSNIRLRGGILDEVPVVPNDATDAIDQQVFPGSVRDTFKDITGFKGQFRDLTRNFEAFFGHNFPEMKKAVLDPFDSAKGAMVDEMDALATNLEENVTKKFGIKRGSEEAKAIQDWGERHLVNDPATFNPASKYHTEEALVKKFGEEKANDIKNAAAWFRKEYDRLVDEVNDVRREIYPNNPDKQIPKRKDYFRHFQELGDSISGLKNLFETNAGISPELVGTSGFTTPRTKFLAFAQQRTGPKSARDAVEGFLNYIPQFAYAKHIDPQIGVFRYLRKTLADNAPRSGTTEKGVKQKGVDHMLQYLTDFANDLAGKTNPMERWIQNTIPGGRLTFKVLDWFNKRVKANTVLGSASSAMAQVFNLPMGLADVKHYALPGIKDTLGSIFVDNVPMAASTFLKERFAQNLQSRFKLSWFDHPVRASTDNARNAAVWMMSAGDEAVTRFLWNSEYRKAVAQKIENPVSFADNATRKIVAGRGVGEVPLGQKAKVFQLLAPFQIEVGNLVWALKDKVDAKDIPALAIYAVSAYYLNNAYQNLTGNRGVFDPINATIEGSASLSQDWKDGEQLRGLEKFTGREVGEILKNLPGGQNIAQLLLDSSGKIPGTGLTAEQFFGNSGTGRYPATPLVMSVFSQPGYKALLPFGGNQIKKTIEGLQTVSKGKDTTPTGKLRYRTADDLEEYVRAALFGKNALPEAQKYHDKLDDAAQATAKPKNPLSL